MKDNILNENLEKKTSLVRLSQWYRPLNVLVENKNGYFELGDIKFYDETGVIVSVGYGYFDDDKELTINGNVIFKIKEDFSKKINYVISQKKSYSMDKRYELYVYVGNVDFKYVGLEKKYDNVYKIYNVNGIEVKKNVCSLTTNSWRYRDMIESEIKKIEGYKLPLNNEEMEIICNNILKYNKLLIDEKQWIKDYEPTVEDLEDNFEKVMKRDI